MINYILSSSLRREQIYDTLRKGILSNEIPNGTILNETKLAKKFGVSNTPVREAIRMLDNEGLVESIPYKGNLAKSPSQEDKIEIYLLRGILESFAGSIAAQKITEEEISCLKEIMQKVEFYLHEKNYEEANKLNFLFHETIWKASRCNRVIRILDNLKVYIEVFRTQNYFLPGQAEISHLEHKKILEALESGDPLSVEKSIIDHV